MRTPMMVELEGLDPTTLNLRTVPDRVASRGDLWSDILAHKSGLEPLFRCSLFGSFTPHTSHSPPDHPVSRRSALAPRCSW